MAYEYRVGFVVDSSQVGPAAAKFDKLAVSANKVVSANRDVSGSTTKAASALGTFSNRAHGFETQINKARIQSANLFAQFNDIGVMMASGQSPFMLAMQQGTQINQVLDQMRNKGQSALPALVGALRSMISPVSLLTLGFIGFGAAAGQALIGLIGKSRELADTLEDMKSITKDFASSVDDAALPFDKMAEKFGSASPALKDALIQLAQIKKLELKESFQEAAKELAGIADYFGSFKTEAEKIAILFDREIVTFSDVGEIKWAKEMADLLDGMANGGTIDEIYTKALKVKENWVQSVPPLEEMGGRQREFNLLLNNMVVELELAGAKVVELENAHKDLAGTIGDMVVKYSEMAAAAIDEYNSVQATIQTYRDKAELSRLAAQYGSDSAEYAAKLRGQVEAAAVAEAKAATSSNSLRNALVAAAMAAHDTAVESDKVAKAQKEAAAFAERGLEVLLKQAEAASDLEQERQLELATLENQMAINQAILNYGADSLEVERARREAYEAAAIAAAEAKYGMTDAAAETVAAAMAAYDLEQAVSKAADQAKRYADNISRGYDDGTAPGTGNAGDGYEGVSSSGSWFDQEPRRQTISIKGLILSQIEDHTGAFEKHLYDSIVAGAEKGFKELNNIVKYSLKENLVTMTVEPGATDEFWADFEFKATNSWTAALTAAFEAGGRSLLAITDDMVKALDDGVVSGATKARFHGRGTNIQLVKFFNNAIDRQLEQMVETKFEVISRGFEGVLRGSATGVREIATVIETERIKKNDGEVILKTFKHQLEEHNKPVRNILRNLATNIIDSVKVYADALNVPKKALGEITQKFKINFKDDTPSDVIAELMEQELEDYANKLAKAVLGSQKAFKRAGESWVDAMERMATDFWGIHNTMKLLGAQTFENNLKGADFASKLVDLFGTPEAYNEAATEFFNAFYSPKEQKRELTKYAKSVFRSVGLDPNDLPETREQLANMLASFNLEKQIGRERYAALLGLTGIFDQILPAFEEDGSSKINKAQERAQKTALSGLSDLISVARNAESAFRRLQESLAKTADQLRATSQTEEQRLEILRRQFDQLYRAGLTGDLDALEKVGGVAKDYVAAFEDSASSTAEARFQAAVVANKLDALSDVAGVGADLSAYQVKQLEKLQEQVENGKITNQKVQNVVDAIGGMDNKLYNALNTLFKARTGNDLTATNTASGTVIIPSSDQDSLVNLNNVNTAGGNDPTSTAISYVNSEMTKLTRTLVRIVRRELDVSKGIRKQTRRSAETLDDIYENGLP